MEPIFGFLLYFLAVVAVMVVAKKRGQAWWLFGVICVGLSFVAVKVIAAATGSGMAAALGAFAVPIGAFFVSISGNTSQQTAVETGAHGDFKKCPFCAESVRKEAIKCKHCGSDFGVGDRAAEQARVTQQLSGGHLWTSA